MVNFNNYGHFRNYCFKIASNKEIGLSKINHNAFDTFEKAYSFLIHLKLSNRIHFKSEPLGKIVDLFKRGIVEEATNIMDYLGRKVLAFEKGEVEIYYIFTSFNSMLNTQVSFTEDFINTRNVSDPYFPSKIRVLEIVNDTEKIYSINAEGINRRGIFGVYFIYDNDGKIAYIGKSSSCAITRSFASASERQLLDFSKIEIRGTKTKSDVAVYEAYYISKYKPYCNNDMVFDDEISLTLPDLKVDKEFIRATSNDYYEYEYSFIRSRSCDIKEVLIRLGDTIFLENEKNQKFLESKGLFDKYTMKSKAYEKCLNEIKQNGDTPVSELKWLTK